MLQDLFFKLARQHSVIPVLSLEGRLLRSRTTAKQTVSKSIFVK